MCGIRGIKHTSIHDHVGFDLIGGRGPDHHSMVENGERTLGFHRLAIMDISELGNQPFTITTDTHTVMWMCNGEIYNHYSLESEYNISHLLTSQSDCECIGYLYQKLGFERMIELLDGEFAIALIVTELSTYTQEFYLGRDLYGVRPLFIGYDKHTIVGRASEAKALVDECETIRPFTAGSFYSSVSDKVQSYLPNHFDTLETIVTDEEQATRLIRHALYDAVSKRLVADRPVGCLLSGGLDSSLVCGIAAEVSTGPIHTYTIGLEGGTDIMYAEMVADHIGSIHQTFIIAIQEALDAIQQVIYVTETRDTTTIRASVWQYLLGQKISLTDTKVLLTGEGADEMCGGYMYFHQAPDLESFDQECRRLLGDIYLYDGLRVDRAMSGHGLEVRIPILDHQVVSTYLSTDPALRIPTVDRMEKYLLRQSFVGRNLIPEEVLRRRKEAFSDGVSQQSKSWYQIIQEYIDTIVTDEEYEGYLYNLESSTGLARDLMLRDVGLNYPKTKEQYYYRRTFVEYFGEQNIEMIPCYRLPKWSGNIIEPSARVLSSYQVFRL